MIQLHAKKRHDAKKGFTLFEIMVALGVIAMALAIIVPTINNYRARSKVNAAQMQLRTIKQGIEFFKGDTGKYPTKLRDLIKRPSDPAIKAKWQAQGYWGTYEEEPEDPWDERYQYKVTAGAKHPYELYSYGPNGRSASQDERINVWDL